MGSIGFSAFFPANRFLKSTTLFISLYSAAVYLGVQVTIAQAILSERSHFTEGF